MLRATMGRVARRSAYTGLPRSSLLRAFLSLRIPSQWPSWSCEYSTPALSFLYPPSVDTVPVDVPPEPSSSRGSYLDEHRAESALKEAISKLSSPHQLRMFFVYLLINDRVPSPISTWKTFQDAFAHDYILQSDNVNVGVNQALEEVGRLLEGHRKTLKDFRLPEPSFHSREVQLEFDQWGTDAEALGRRADAAVMRLNNDQHVIYTEIIRAVQEERPLRAFVDGKAGRGKTFLVNAICDKLRSLGKIVLPTATSAFAAQLYPGGKTTHSTFRVPIQAEDNKEKLVSPIEPSDPRGELIREASVIIWDEAPMAHNSVLACVEETCRRVMRNDLPFGGKVVILLGDFRQTCPVIRNGTRHQVVEASIRSSPLWEQVAVYRLTRPIRNAMDLPYADFVDTIGDGLVREAPLDMLEKVMHEEDLIQFVYPNDVLQDPASCLRRAILAPTNKQVDGYNNEILSRVEGIQRTYFAADVLKEGDDLEEEDTTPPELILEEAAKRSLPGVPAYTLTLKINGVYRLMCNFAPDRGLVKNTRVVVVSIGKRVVTVRCLRGVGGVNVVDTEDILISRINFTAELDTGHILVRRQFPLAPAYATTFNSCQGLTLDVVGVDLTRPVFSHGQLYTALSRIRHRSHAVVRLNPNQSTTRNVTFNEVLI